MSDRATIVLEIDSLLERVRSSRVSAPISVQVQYLELELRGLELKAKIDYMSTRDD